MATEILINDGGAPARILPYTAGVALSAGDAVCLDAAGKLQLADTGVALRKFAYLGICLVDVTAAGDIASVITGVGVVLNINTDPVATVLRGSALMMGATTAGYLALATNAAGAAKAQAYALEAAPAAAGLTLCQTI